MRSAPSGSLVTAWSGLAAVASTTPIPLASTCTRSAPSPRMIGRLAPGPNDVARYAGQARQRIAEPAGQALNHRIGVQHRRRRHQFVARPHRPQPGNDNHLSICRWRCLRPTLSAPRWRLRTRSPVRHQRKTQRTQRNTCEQSHRSLRGFQTSCQDVSTRVRRRIDCGRKAMDALGKSGSRGRSAARPVMRGARLHARSAGRLVADRFRPQDRKRRELNRHNARSCRGDLLADQAVFGINRRRLVRCSRRMAVTIRARRRRHV